MIDHTPLTNGDRGLIVVGGRKEFINSGEKLVHERFEPEEDSKPILSEAELEKVKQEALNEPTGRKRVRKLQGLDAPEGAEEDEETEESREEENHFSYYAFEGHTGALRWKHEPDDFQDLGDTQSNLQQALDLFAQPTADVC
jgi:hypothetical protein